MMLEMKYPGKEISFNLRDVDFQSEMFKVIITAEDGTAEVYMLCLLDDSGIFGVYLDQEVIVF